MPKTTEPLAKFIRTGEGVLVFAFNIALLVVPIVSHALTAAQSAKWATIIDGVAVVSRTGLKMLAQVQTGNAAQLLAAAQPGMPAQPLVGSAASSPNVALPGAASPALPAPAASINSLASGVADIASLVSDVDEFANMPSPVDSTPGSGSALGPGPSAGRQPGALIGSAIHGSHGHSFTIRVGD